MATGVASWSQTAASNSTADSTVGWAEGQAPSTVNDSARAMMASVAKYRDDIAGTLTTGGTTTAFTLTSNQLFASLSALSGNKFLVRFNATNGASPTLNIDSLGAKAIQTASGTAVETGAILANSVHELVYDNSIPAFLLSGVLASASGTFGGNVTIGGTLAVTGAASFTAAPVPSSSDVAALGSASLMWSDLFLASGAVVNFNNGDVTVTHSANTLAFAGASSGYTFDTSVTVGSGFTVSAGAVALPAASVADAALAAPGSMKLLQTVTASSSATVDLETTIDSTYDQYLITVERAMPASDDQPLNVRFKIGGSYLSGATDYWWNSQIILNATSGINGDVSDTEISTTAVSAGSGVGNDTAECIDLDLRLSRPALTTGYPHISWTGSYERATDGALCSLAGNGRYNGTGAVTGVRFLFASGNIASGIFRLYGIKKS